MTSTPDNKRKNSEDDSAKSNKKQTATRQASLLSMFKPVATAEKPSSVSSEKTENTDTLTVARNPEDLFRKLDPELRSLLDLEINTLQYEWLKALKPELTKPYFLQLKRFLKKENEAKVTIYPAANQIYSWSNFTPPNKVKVVILGQDPYHNVNQAHGLSFSVLKGVNTPPSLVNIYEALRRDYPDFKKPNHGYLAKWAEQGVMMLNASLTVEAHKAGSHSKKGWEPFTDAVIKYLNEHKAHIVFLLWGAHAQKKGAGINKAKHLVLRSVHPSPLSAHRGFLDCHHFKQANDYLIKNGQQPIDWNCLADS
ncbi:uracil-DNA glycosylase-like protein [Radiomyces spectabilis]|uniref:uracil-DNA glycosylase-like protein n=1 Tax=Radiomyces spectabilis TaxID=64574 RepID=UPI00221FA0C7|nr:uracil-DNA glycosylase-like protein [Radiomyces spectabilis]KAI8388182.1 uracil-DNA glycosylase-like protein [Radiomyces spectabilis]